MSKSVPGLGLDFSQAIRDAFDLIAAEVVPLERMFGVARTRSACERSRSAADYPLQPVVGPFM